MTEKALRTEVRGFPDYLGLKLKAGFADWLAWWKGQGLLSRLLPVGFFGPYWLALYALGGLRADHIEVGLIILFLSYAGRLARVVRDFLLPLVLTGILYDSQRYYEDYIRGPIHVQQPYEFDKWAFGIRTAQGVLTPNEWCQLHTHWVLDLFTGFAYLVFIAVFVLSCAAFRFYYSRRGTRAVSGPEILRRSPAMMWSFFWVNMIGYSTYYWYAAAPPWYVALYGLGPARMDVRPNQAGCVRFDHLLGTHFFSDFYGKSADVFGAIPSLHVSYPLIAAFFAFRFGALRIPTVLFFLWMCFSAVYLNHHYVLDILWGSSYAIAVACALDFWYRCRPL